MIGNDIIDLALTRVESNWQRKGFLEKLFTTFEQSLIYNSENPEQMVWHLWSRKEAAYKIYHRETKIRAFIPKQIECFSLPLADDFSLGKVGIADQEYFTKTEVTSEFIYATAVVNLKDFDKIQTINSNEIAKDSDGIPFHVNTKNPVSISHHGRFERKITLDCNVQSRF